MAIAVRGREAICALGAWFKGAFGLAAVTPLPLPKGWLSLFTPSHSRLLPLYIRVYVDHPRCALIFC